MLKQPAATYAAHAVLLYIAYRYESACYCLYKIPEKDCLSISVISYVKHKNQTITEIKQIGGLLPVFHHTYTSVTATSETS